MKLIREGRMGPPKSFKTGAVVGTYPKPMLVFQFDRGGVDIIPSRSTVPSPDLVPMDVCYEDLVFVKPDDWKLDPNPPKVTVIDLTEYTPITLSFDESPVKSMEAFNKFQGPSGVYNRLAAVNGGFPYKTVVFDTISGYMEVVKSWLSSYNAAAMTDARKWAFQVGEKVRQLVNSAGHFPCHVVFIFHTVPPEADEETKLLQELPHVYSKLKGSIGGLFSQFVYSTKSGNKPVVKTASHQYVTGLGNRFPAGLPNEVAPDFKSIYGKELE